MVVFLAGVVLALFCLYAFIIKPLRFINHFAQYGIRSLPFRPLVGQLGPIIAADKHPTQDLNSWWLATQQELGDVFIMSMGPFPQLVVADPQFSHDIFTSCAQYYHKTSEQNKKLVRPLLGNGLLLSEGKYWEKQRAFVEPSFHWKKLATMIDSLAACSDDAIRKMVQPPPLTAEASELHKAPPPPGAEKAVELHASIVGFSFDVIARVAFGTSFGNQPGTTARFIDAMHHMLRSVKDRVLITMVPIISDIPFPSLKRMRKACATVHDIVRDVVSSRTQAEKQSREGKESTDVLNILLGACKALPDGSFCEEDAKMLQEESVNFIAAASETTSNVLTWLVYKLVQDAQLWAQVSSEVQRVCPHGKIPTYDDLKALVFLEACIYETQRLFSPVPIIMKLAVEDHTVVWRKTDSMGLPCPVKVLIPAGTNVCIHADLIHRHAKYWPNPFTFDPTRFLAPIDGGGDALKRGEGSAFAQNVPHPFSFLGFAAGPRKCLGKNLAILEIKTFVVRLVQKVKLDLVGSQSIFPEIWSRQPKNGIYVKVAASNEKDLASNVQLCAEVQGKSLLRGDNIKVLKPLGII